jgi:hypothetical protein
LLNSKIVIYNLKYINKLDNTVNSNIVIYNFGLISNTKNTTFFADLSAVIASNN